MSWGNKDLELTSAQLWERIHRSGLAGPEVCRAWATELSKATSPSDLQNPQRLAAELIRSAILTPFQLGVLLEPTPFRLVVGPYQLRDTLSDRLGTNWFEAVDVIRGMTKWCYQWTKQDLQRSEAREWPPSIELGRFHSCLEHPNLDRWESVLTEPGVLAAVGDPIHGEPLSNRLVSERLAIETSLQMVKQIASGLQAMHAAGLVHGCITSEYVWRDTAGIFRLRRDPLFPPRSPWMEWRGSHPVAELNRRSIAAPEFSVPGTVPSVQTDLYALGVLWAYSLVGRVPWQNAEQLDSAGWRKTQHKVPISLPAECPERIASLIRYLVAKNPKNRFESAKQLLDSFENPSASVVSSTELPVQPLQRPANDGSKTSQASSKEKQNVAPEKSKNLGSANPIGKPVADISPKAESKLEGPARTAVSPSQSLAPATKVGTKATAGRPLSKKKKKKKPIWLLPALGLGSMVLLGGLLVLLMRGGNGSPAIPDPLVRVVDPDKSNPSSAAFSKSEPVAPPDPLSEYFQLAPDNSQTLWAPPTAGLPDSVELLPPGSETIVFFSRAAWNGRGTLEKIQPWWLDNIPAWKQFTKSLPWNGEERVARVAIALYPVNDGSSFEAVTRYTLQEPASVENLLKSASGFSAKPLGKDPKKQMWQQGNKAIVFDGLSSNPEYLAKRITIGPVELIESMADIDGGSIPLRRQMESLLQASDSRNDLVVIGVPSFVLGAGKELLTSTPNAAAPLREFLNDGVQAFSFASSLEPQLYGEWRMILSDATGMGKTQSGLRQRMDRLADAVEASYVASPPPAYWRAIAARFPQMLRSVAKNCRYGLEENHVVVNAYLPRESVGNLAIATWMSLQTTSTTVSTNVPKSPPTPNKITVEQWLESPLRVSFDQESLEMGLNAIGTEFNESVVKGEVSLRFSINGSAFQKEGITQNQQIRDFRQESVPLRQVLTDLVRRANPVTTVQSPTEKDQKVVWLLIEDPESAGGKRIELTTRTWAESNSKQLPKEFEGIR